MSLEDFKKGWENQIAKIESEATGLDERAVQSIKLQFDIDRSYFEMVADRTTETSDVYMELTMLDARLNTALEAARSRNHAYKKDDTTKTPNIPGFGKVKLIRVASSKRFFISHSSKDETLIGLTNLAFKNNELQPYFAGKEIEAKNPVEKIIQAIDSSFALFAYITPNVVSDKHTRDWVNFELGAAKMKGLPIVCLIDENVSSQGSFPELVKNLTDYEKFDCTNQDSCIRIVNMIREKAAQLNSKQ
ncbi:MAG: toll/interleukin-1 receptor domain-containing protein [Candidatus Bathyarchaeota archaeon]|nr:toll/interleukin-1 receptor domain-containing protein [Candidatus Bathyarchaeota archaeon]